MKTILIIFIAYLTFYNCNAQDLQLFENDWYLQKVVIDDIDYFPPIEVNNVFLSFYTDYNFYTHVCQSISSNSVTITNDSFNVDFFYILPDGNCDETLYFENIYFNDFFNWQEPNNIYYYTIEDGTDGFKTLTLTNALNHVAIYGNELLSNQDFDNLYFSMYPNPVVDILYIEKQHSVQIKNSKVYDILGRLVLEEKGDKNQLDVSSLAKSLFFVKIETEKGSITKKIIKQ